MKHKVDIATAPEPITGRTGTSAGLVKSLNKVFPRHFSFLFGEVALYSFVVLVLTGVYLGGFGASHPLAKKLGAWPSVLTVAGVSAASAWAFSDRNA